MPESKRRLKVFLCHASGDKPAMTELYQRLTEAGVDAWLDREKPGLEMHKAVSKGSMPGWFLSNL